MKILHTADWHLGKIVNEYNLLAEQKLILEQIKTIAINEKIEVILISGDIFDRALASASAIQLLDQFLVEFVKLGIKIVMIGGNHDGYERLSYGKELLAQSGIYIQANHQELYQKVTINEIDFYLVNYFDPVFIREITDNNQIKTHNDAFQLIIEQINDNFNSKKNNILLAHGYFVANNSFGQTYEEKGLKISESERPLAIGNLDVIDLKAAEMFDYIALGHLHQHQEIIKDKAYYSGSIYPFSFSEANHKKGCYIVNTSTKEIEYKEFELQRKFCEINGTFNEIVEKYENTQIEDYVKIILDEKTPIINVVEKLKPIFQNIMQVTYKESVEATAKKLMANEIAQSNPQDLYQDFYFEVTNEKMNKSQQEIIMKIVDEIKKEENNASD